MLSSLPAATTVKVQVSVKLPCFTVITAVPGATAVTFPVASTVATFGLEDVHVADSVSVVLAGISEAESCVLRPVTTVVLFGEMVMPVAATGEFPLGSSAASTVTTHDFESLPCVAVIVAVPGATAVILPLESTVATALSELLHEMLGVSVVFSGAS